MGDSIAPIAFDDDFVIQQGALSTTFSGSLLSGDGDGRDHDPDGQAIGWATTTHSLDMAFFSGGQLGFVEIVGTVSYPHPIITHASFLTTANGGRVIIETDGDFVYQSAAGFSGTDWFDYALIDESFSADTARVTITVTPSSDANDMPVAKDDVFNGFEDQPISGSLLVDNGNGIDSDPDGDTLTVQNETILTAAGGVVSIYVNGTFLYTPRSDFHGLDSFSYTVIDPLGARDSANVALTVDARNDSPLALADAFSVQHGKVVSGNVLADNGAGPDSDPDGDTLSVQPASLITTMGGQVTLLADGSFSYEASDTFVGPDSFSYTLLDGVGGIATGTVSLSVLNRAPTAVVDHYTGTTGRSVVGNVLTNDVDADGDELRIDAASITTAKGGSVSLAQDGSFTYTPSSFFIGFDSFTYRVTDGVGGATTGIVSVTYPSPSGALYGTDNADSVNGTAASDTIFAGDEDDLVHGKGGNDLISGGDDDDRLVGDGGNDILSGDKGKDALNAGAGDDTLYGGKNDDNLVGGAGNDVLRGDAGKDAMTGGLGGDRFDFNSVTEIGNGATRDVITDFLSSTDHIDLSTIDANGAAAGDTFTFLAAAGSAFTSAGQLRWYQSSGNTYVEGNTGGTLAADFQIQLTGLKSLTTGDFIL